MEEDIHKTPGTGVRDRLVQQRLVAAIKEAETRNDYEAAHNEPLLKALGIVKKFIRTKGRVCYGGTAMNELLPLKDRFYNPETDLPDFDFFTPEPAEDVEHLVADLKGAGFTDVYHRVGMHEGTTKILVNFVPVADITAISGDVYSVLAKRATIRGGIRYTDPDVLRMMMYLELSRPKGEVARWEKVFERLHLINSQFPPRALRITRRHDRKQTIPKEVRRSIMDFCIEKQRILFTGELDTFYHSVIDHKTRMFPLENGRDVIGLLTPDIKGDVNLLKNALGGDKNVVVISHKARGELVPEYMELRYQGAPAVLLFQEVACHSYLHFATPDGRSIAIASPDTLITLYYAIALFTKRASQLVSRIGTMLPALIATAERNRRSRRPAIPAFPLSCRGYQKGKATLLREKVARILRAKEGTRKRESR